MRRPRRRPPDGPERADRPGPADPLATPFVIVIDTREQRPFAFDGLVSDAREGRRPLAVRTVVRGLASGDYSIDGLEGEVAVERKSIADLYGTLGQGRERFERELTRLDAMKYAAVVVEGEWSAVLSGDGAPHSELNPKTVFRSVIAWSQRLTRVHWWMCAGRVMAEVATYRILERYWRDYVNHAEA